MTDVEEHALRRHIPVPSQNLESKPFWDAARVGKFLIKRCNACGHPHWYPRTTCPFCHSTDTEWKESKGEGEIYTFSIMRRGAPAPYAIGYVKLDEGIALLTNFVDCDFDTLEIGQRVKLKWTPTRQDEPPVFTFSPAG